MRRRSFSLLALAACVPGEKSPTGEAGTIPPHDGDERTRSMPRASGDVAQDTQPVTADALAARVEALTAEFGPRGFSVIAQSPWIVLGDESHAEVQRRATGTVAWASRHLADAFFSRDPTVIVEIWLFRDINSYMAHAKSIFGDEPDTPFGYYSFAHQALIMNIASGGGTLVHEMVHPLMRANFPACPSWFNEGLASLFEQCGQENGRIVGYTNWRLAGLQQAIADGTVPSFETLLATTEDGFYSDDLGTNYAQARYLCYWLQEQGKLRAFYRDFVATAEADPTGIEALARHANTHDLGAFQRQWEAYVTRLRFEA
ncbi:MAG: hypothetical protein JKY37_09530 [Nannocystaceae bacterium]|nr:hypothetical protein [Nannocystaceae bacterium]